MNKGTEPKPRKKLDMEARRNKRFVVDPVSDETALCDTLKKRARKWRQFQGKGGFATGHPTKKHTRGRKANYDSSRGFKFRASKARYENLLNRLYANALSS